MATLVCWPRLAISQSAVPVRSPSRVTDMREMVMFQNANVYVWLRATDEGTVLVYASSGFRNAFAQPVTLTAEEADRWAALAEPLMADSLQQAVTRRERPDTTSTRDQLAFGDFVLISRPRTDPPTLVVKIGELGPDVVSTTFFAPALRPVVPAIREAARAAREMMASRVSDSTARAAALVVATAPPQPAPSPATPSPATPGVTGNSSPAAAPPAPTVPSAPVRVTEIASAAPSLVTLAPAQPVAGPPEPPLVPESAVAQPLIAPPPSVPAAVLTTATLAAAPAVKVAAPAVPSVDARSLPAMTAPTVAAPTTNVVQRPVPASATLRVAAPPSPPAAVTAAIAARDTARPSAARTTTVNVRAPVRTITVGLVATTTPVIAPAPTSTASSNVPPAPARATPPPPAIATTSPSPAIATAPASSPLTPAPATGPPAAAAAVDDGGLSDAEFTTETHRRESSVTACYAQYGLSINPSLSGHVTVRISLSDSGEVMRATVVDRSWSAAVPTDVESCIVHRVFVWHFPVARRSSIHDYTVSFGP
jgi:hypothetical protein